VGLDQKIVAGDNLSEYLVEAFLTWYQPAWCLVGCPYQWHTLTLVDSNLWRNSHYQEHELRRCPECGWRFKHRIIHIFGKSAISETWHYAHLLEDAYQDYAKDFRKRKIISNSQVPDSLRSLLPLAHYWGILEHKTLYALLAKEEIHTLNQISTSIEAHIDNIHQWVHATRYDLEILSISQCFRNLPVVKDAARHIIRLKECGILP
jgi:hypothetical protein